MSLRVKRLVRLKLADDDVSSALAHCIEEAPQVADKFIDALEDAFRHIQRAPATGSPRYAHELNLPGLRFWACRRFPYLVFYMEHADRIDVWRVLHSHRDMPSWLAEPVIDEPH
jgi:toxin ParE1/3/4